MNERIKQLAKDAGLEMCGCGCDMPSKQAAKFAQLIIAEAAAYLVGATEVHNQREQDFVNTAAKKMTEHFTKRIPKCSICGTTENVTYMGGYQPYLCDSNDCIPF